MPNVILKAYFSELTDGEHTVRFVCGSEEEHERFEKDVRANDSVEICLSQYICTVGVDDLLCPPQPVKGEEKLKERVNRGLHDDD